jgi:RNA polymerase sigma-70 factor (ECF subfamily)
LENKFVNIHQDLINACIEGDRKAQFEIYRKYHKAMYNTSVRILNNSAEAEDVIQEAFLDAFRRIRSYSGEGSFGSWLKRIVVNRSLDVLRKAKEMVSLDQIDRDIPDEPVQVTEDDIVFRVEEVKRAVALLQDDYRIILTLILFEGYDHEEVSEMLNITNQLSRTRYSRARQKLLVSLKERNIINAYSVN